MLAHVVNIPRANKGNTILYFTCLVYIQGLDSALPDIRITAVDIIQSKAANVFFESYIDLTI